MFIRILAFHFLTAQSLDRLIVLPRRIGTYQRYRQVADNNCAFLHPFRNAISAVVAKLQFNSFISRARGLFEEDRLLFALLVALEIEDSNSRIEVGEREFLISPPFGVATKQYVNQNWELPPKTLVKKPFDWLMDEQYHNLQVSYSSTSPGI